MVRVIERGERENIFRKIEARVAAEALFAAVMRMIEADLKECRYISPKSISKRDSNWATN